MSNRANEELPVYNSLDSHKTVEDGCGEEERDQIPTELQELRLEVWDLMAVELAVHNSFDLHKTVEDWSGEED